MGATEHEAALGKFILESNGKPDKEAYKKAVESARTAIETDGRLKRLDALACDVRLYVRRRDLSAETKLAAARELVEKMKST